MANNVDLADLARYVMLPYTITRISGLPDELQDCIFAYIKLPASQRASALIPRTANAATDPSIPPANGRCVFIQLPKELLAAVLGIELLSKNSIIKPTCGEDLRKDPTRTPKRNRTSDFMVLNKEIKRLVTYMIYKERRFEIHVHQGVNTAGIEFLDVGRQPLHYQLDTGDARFERFTERGDFEFGQLKKIDIKIFQSEEDVRDKITISNTYFIHQALCQLLERNNEDEKDRIVSIRISFEGPHPGAQTSTTGRAQIMANEYYWWHPDQKKPRSTCLQGLSDIELVLRPFSRLSKVHNVDVELPKGVAGHAPTIQFKNDLIRSMTCKDNGYSLPAHDILEAQMQGPRIAAENFSRYKKYGGKPGNDVADIAADELFDHTFDSWPKRDRSRGSEVGSRIGSKRQKTAMLRHESSLGLEFGRIGLMDKNEHADEPFAWANLSGAEQWALTEEQRAIERSLGDSQGGSVRREPSDDSGSGVPLTGQLHRMRFPGGIGQAGPATRNCALDAAWPPILPENVHATSVNEPVQRTGTGAWQKFAEDNAEQS
ncbi:uncharacterized protein MYCFIDRAFT_174200 [Pseudocercospora fijiensis CIRAD86]|uniref:Uncharacterized protein n=1 Tax=Pseudocercospora fijiensis (strain CIRAD86) TaxID=383855 RepID=M2YY99_PSEFD|nr:uncharacterized protein MYCFIDRAFT_174200 [Pseudocercospora fijiensis CIRAD86]EME82630.1 hypothetical protein MYCFIDRAFT_174200 [Pseudocercospora fijiensis CIRAD86]